MAQQDCCEFARGKFKEDVIKSKNKKLTVPIHQLKSSVVKIFGSTFKLPLHRVGLLEKENA